MAFRGITCSGQLGLNHGAEWWRLIAEFFRESNYDRGGGASRKMT
jgi:hypothetical protein